MLTWLFGEDESEAERPGAFDQGLLDGADAGERWQAGRRPKGKGRRWLFNGAKPEPVPSHLGPVEGPVEERLGICSSGGGIRSAAFSLGALQTLQEKGELRRASYLAAVSGGSYIAAAFSMVAARRRGGTPPGESDDSDPLMLNQMPPFAPGSPEEQYLRNRCSYIAPTFTDKVYIAFRILLGMLINLVFVSLFLVGVAWLFTGLFLAPQLPDLVGDCDGGGQTCAAGIPDWFWIAPVSMAALAFLIGWLGMLVKVKPDSRDRAVQIWAARLLIGGSLAALLLVLVPTLVDLLLRPENARDDGTPVEVDISTTLTSFGSLFAGLIAGVAAQLWRLFHTKEGREGAAKAVKAAGKAGNGTLKAIAYVAGLLGPLTLFVVFVVAVSLGLEWSSHGFDNSKTIGLGLGALGAFAFFYVITDLTTWSLHPYYKRRLATAFALKRVNPRDLTEDELNRVEALPSPAPDSVGIAIERDFEKIVPLSQTALVDVEEIDEDGHKATMRTEWPTLLVCAAANVSDPGATPPGRRVSSFTFSAHAVGGPLVGAVKTNELESAFNGSADAEGGQAARVSERRRRDLTMISAVAMSGAAISPSMGKMTPRPLTLLMALANLRLGVWVPNPRWVNGTDPDARGISEAESRRRRRDRKKHPRPRPIYLFREFLGRNRIDARYLYVTDGGHYENLGLVELLRRGCTQVYCFDASGVGEGRAEFGALGEAIALARSELNVEIEFGDDEDPGDLQPRGAAGEPRFSRDQVVEGRIRYSNGTEGTLIYVRNVMTREAPWDAQAYQRIDPRFPNNPTIDQLYTDQKFESYRALGRLAAREAYGRMGVARAEDVVASYD